MKPNLKLVSTIVSATITVLTLGLSIVDGKKSEAAIKDAVAKEVAKQLTNKN